LNLHLFSQSFVLVLFLALQGYSNDTLNDVSATSSTSAKQQSDSSGKFTYTPSGFATLQGLRIVKYQFTQKEYSGLQENNVVTNLTLDFNMSEHFKVHLGIEGYVWFNDMPDQPITGGQVRILGPQWSFYIHQAENVYLLGNVTDWFSGELGLGYFPYKYNPDSRNLGEYLFRSGTYPGWIVTNFDWPKARLTGGRFSSTLFGAWHNDILLTTEMELYPLYDLSASWISDYNLAGIFDIGGGIEFARIIPYRNDWTTPKGNIAQGGVVDNSYVKGIGDTAYYTFQGTKAMARLSIDPKGISPEFFNFLGKDDGKIYGEVAILGLKNQGTLYNKLSERTPVMFGANIPAFKLLDVMACEFEYYTTPYPDNYERQLIPYWDGTPLPWKINTATSYSDGHVRWKWSVYAKESLGKHFAFIAQAARDHWRSYSSIGYYVHDAGTGMVSNKDWYWALKAVSFF
jgi:hypothetical protein